MFEEIEPDESVLEDCYYNEAWMVERYGDFIYLTLSNADGESRILEFRADDALDIGTALAQAGYTPENEENDE